MSKTDTVLADVQSDLQIQRDSLALQVAYHQQRADAAQARLNAIDQKLVDVTDSVAEMAVLVGAAAGMIIEP